MTSVESLAIQPNIYYTVDEAAHLLRVSRQTMLRLLQSERLRLTGIKIGRQWRILGAALLDLSAREEESEAALVADWFKASTASLAAVWNNEEDAVYDNL